MNKILLSVNLLLCAVAQNSWPAESTNGKCPAINFSHNAELDQFGKTAVRFRPSLLSAARGFDFVDIHLTVVNEFGKPILNMVNERMESHPEFFTYPIENNVVEMIHAGNCQLKYSFTYSVQSSGNLNAAICNTAVYQSTVPDVDTRWVVVPVKCPSECDLPTSSHIPLQQCTDSFGNGHPACDCYHMVMPEVDPVQCPSTEPCALAITFDWEGIDGECPTECGLPSSRLLPMLICVGSDGLDYHDEHCTQLSKPQPKQCSATPACTAFTWEAQYPECNSDCGQPTATVQPFLTCVGSDGLDYRDEHCVNVPQPKAKKCPATAACTSFYWEAQFPDCPTECGLPASIHHPQLICVGSDGLDYHNEHCSQVPKPESLKCDATPACAPKVKLSWKVVYDTCTTECGCEEQEHFPIEVTCMGSDGMLYSNERCAYLPTPTSLNCPATEPCPQEKKYELKSVTEMKNVVEKVPTMENVIRTISSTQEITTTVPTMKRSVIRTQKYFTTPINPSTKFYTPLSYSARRAYSTPSPLTQYTIAAAVVSPLGYRSLRRAAPVTPLFVGVQPRLNHRTRYGL